MSDKDDYISRRDAIDALHTWFRDGFDEDKWWNSTHVLAAIEGLPSTQPKYEPVKAEDFAKTMSENTIYSFIAWYGTVLELIEKQGFTICKKTM